MNAYIEHEVLVLREPPSCPAHDDTPPHSLRGALAAVGTDSGAARLLANLNNYDREADA